MIPSLPPGLKRLDDASRARASGIPDWLPPVTDARVFVGSGAAGESCVPWRRALSRLSRLHRFLFCGYGPSWCACAASFFCVRSLRSSSFWLVSRPSGGGLGCGRVGFAGFQAFSLAGQSARARTRNFRRCWLCRRGMAATRAPLEAAKAALYTGITMWLPGWTCDGRGKTIGPDKRVDRDSIASWREFAAVFALRHDNRRSALRGPARGALPPRGGGTAATGGFGCGGGLALADGALSGRDCTGDTRHRRRGRRRLGSATFAELWKGLDQGSLRRSELAQPASKPAATPVRARRNAKRALETQTKSVMTQPTDEVSNGH